MSSSSSQTPVVLGEAFAKGDVDAFRLLGGQIASRGAPKAPKKRGILGTARTSKRSLLGGGFTTEEAFVNPGQEFVSDAEVTRLIDIFQKRSEEISNRRLAPGVTQTRLIGR